MTELPERVPIGDEMFTVKVVRRAWFKSDYGRVVGDLDWGACVIRIAVGGRRTPLPSDAVWAALYHEVEHACDFAADEARSDFVGESMNYLADWRKNRKE